MMQKWQIKMVKKVSMHWTLTVNSSQTLLMRLIMTWGPNSLSVKKVWKYEVRVFGLRQLHSSWSKCFCNLPSESSWNLTRFKVEHDTGVDSHSCPILIPVPILAEPGSVPSRFHYSQVKSLQKTYLLLLWFLLLPAAVDLFFLPVLSQSSDE